MQRIPTELANHIFANHGISLRNAAVCVLGVAAAQYHAMHPALAYQYARDIARRYMQAEIDTSMFQADCFFNCDTPTFEERCERSR